MITTTSYPTTKSELVRSIQRSTVDKIKVFEPYLEHDKKEFDTTVRALRNGTGDVCVIILRSK